MHPKYLGDHYEFVKIQMLRGLARVDRWDYHPMYFAANPLANFPLAYAHFLDVDLLQGDIWHRPGLVEVCQGCKGNLFLDPDKGLGRRGGDEHVRLEEIVEIAQTPDRQDSLTLVYDQSISHDFNRMGDPRIQIQRKLLDIYRNHDIYGAAYVSSLLAFVWVSANAHAVHEATQTLLKEFQLPGCRIIENGQDQIYAIGCQLHGLGCQQCDDRECVAFPYG